jgi:serine/threonine-protein phosphatase 2A regulatory subunit B'
MVYNAMKLFMEINPQLFDECSHDYTEHQSSTATREATRQRKWAVIAEQASQRKGINGVGSSNGGTSSSPSSRAGDTVDPAAEDNQKRLDSLKLQDADRRDRRPGMHERQASAGSGRSGR